MIVPLTKSSATTKTAFRGERRHPMVIDTSALVAILEHEPERRAFLDAIEAADARRMSIANYVEVSMVAERRRGPTGLSTLDEFISSAGIELIGVDVEQGRAARVAFSRFGKGRQRAGLNYGDCFAYALAKVLAEPLLCKGDDFARTDLALAVE
jgi:ribonuclease VapC